MTGETNTERSVGAVLQRHLRRLGRLGGQATAAKGRGPNWFTPETAKQAVAKRADRQAAVADREANPSGWRHDGERWRRRGKA